MKVKPKELAKRVRVVANVHDIDTGRYSVEVRYQHMVGERSILFPRKMIRHGTELLDELLDHGALLPTGHGAGSELAAILSVVPKRTYRTTNKTGWVDENFVFPDVTIGPDADTVIHANRKSGKKPAPATKGTLEDWLTGLKEPSRASSYLTFGVALAFAGPLLNLVHQPEGAIFYLAGRTTTGKTLCELAGLSAIERAIRDSLLTHDATPRAIEEDCWAHNDLLQVIDEISRSEGSQAENRAKVCRLAHKITSGAGTRRSAKARQDSDLADLNWRLTCLWSGEHSLGAEFLGEKRSRGELVRLIEIPVPETKDNGVFDRLDAVSVSWAELAERAEAAIRDNYGHAIRAFIQKLVAKRQTCLQRAAELIDRFLKRVGADTDPWARRLAIKFAVIYAAARLAAEFGVAPWTADHPFKCIERLYKRARALIVTPEEALSTLLHQLANGASSTDRFPQIRKGESLPTELKQKAWGIRYETKDGILCLAVESAKLDRLVNPAHHSDRVRGLLAKGGYIVPGKEGRHVRQIKVQGFGSTDKPYFICIRLDRLPSHRS